MRKVVVASIVLLVCAVSAMSICSAGELFAKDSSKIMRLQPTEEMVAADGPCGRSGYDLLSALGPDV